MPNETAMLLTEQEWEDLAYVCGRFLEGTAWSDRPQVAVPTRALETLKRRRVLCKRVLDAVYDD